MLNPRTRISYLVPDHLRARAEADIEASRAIWPPWVCTLHVRWEDADDEEAHASASVWVQYEYRSVTLTLFSLYFTREDEERRNDLAHEIAHVLMAPYAHRPSAKQTEEEAAEDIAFVLCTLWERILEQAKRERIS